MTILFIALGGVAGTLSRYGLEGWIQARTASGFPLGTLIVNLTGSFLIGFILRVATGATLISPDLRAGLTIGFCGAFTTMSTFSYESVTLLNDGDYFRAGLYMSATDHGKPLYEALLERFRTKGLAGATVLRGVAGFGASSTMHTDKVLRLSVDLPLIIEVVETEEVIQGILPDLSEMIGGGLITLEKANVILYRPGK